jgi:hypothetical protein
MAILMATFGASTSMYLLEKDAHRDAVLAEKIQIQLRDEAETNEQSLRKETEKNKQIAAFLKQLLMSVAPSVSPRRDIILLSKILGTIASGQQKGEFVDIPTEKPFPFPYYEKFDEYTDPRAWG